MGLPWRMRPVTLPFLLPSSCIAPCPPCSAAPSFCALPIMLPCPPCCPQCCPPCRPLPPPCAVRGLLLDSRKSQVGSHVAAVAEGLLAAPPSGGPDDTARHAAGLAAAAGQQAQVAMLCLERLISLGEPACRRPALACRLAGWLGGWAPLAWAYLAACCAMGACRCQAAPAPLAAPSWQLIAAASLITPGRQLTWPCLRRAPAPVPWLCL